MNGWTTLRGALLASRWPNLLIIAATQGLGAYLLLRNGLISEIDTSLLWLILSTGMVAAGGYIINDYYDQKIDMINRPREVVVGTSLSRRWALGWHGLLSVLAIILGFWISPAVGAMHCLSTFLLWYFSNTLRRHFLGKMVIGILTAMAVLAVAVNYGVVSYKLLAFALFGGGLVWIRELIKDIESAKGNRVHGVKDMVGIWGLVGTKWFIGLLGLVSLSSLIVFTLKIGNPYLMVYYSLMIPLLVSFSIYLYRADRRTHFRRLRILLNVIIAVGLISMLII